MPAPPVGLDITPTALIAVVVRKKGKSYAVAKHAVSPLPHGIVGDGEVLDVPRLAEAIAAFFKQHNIKSKTVALGVANQRCIVRTIELTRIRAKKDLRSAISFEVDDLLPIPLEEAVWDFDTIDNFKDEQGIVRQRHIIVASYRESMERYRDAVHQAGLKLRRIDLSAFALMRSGLMAVRASVEAEQAAIAAQMEGSVPETVKPSIAICDIGPTMTNLVVARDGICELNRIVAVGTQHFAHALSEQFGWSDEDARRVASEAGILPLGGTESPGDPYTQARGVLQAMVDQYAQELRTSFDYYAHVSEGVHRVTRVVIAGEGALLRGIEDRLAAELQIPVSIFDASPRLDSASVDSLGVNHAHYAAALGLAMEDAA
jgi:type IV pilus assembly protein PilM